MTAAPVFPDYDATLRELPTHNGVLRYHEYGDGPPLVLLHGSGPGVSGWRNFRGNISVFGEHFRCLVLEFPGFGVSDDWGGHPMSTALSALELFVDELELETFDVVGNSMGGGVGIGYDLAHPGRIGKLVTIGGVGRNIFSPGPGEGIKLLQEFTENPTREALTQWLNSMVYDPAVVTEQLIEERWRLAVDPIALESARRMYGRVAFTEMMRAMHESDAPPQWSMLHKVRAKTLITWGRDDRVSPLDMALIPMRLIPNVELHVFPNCGHWAMIEAKADFERTVRSFLLQKN
ncbi:alpha/beta fold hydrolase [Gordonia liuliyuniae]|uniref:Alpha/beta fold hydrolase n=1 Tax=Gordonia liuliyuniae TaxID=2911517 RepID=A0ABS9IQ89_9ACTN|nr:alpha/beta fold hydrolase [Gordonia liuliyuniae]MCF8587718.1 alpha/beta fold hydrolase [Gordonia liuliyuniae]